MLPPCAAAEVAAAAGSTGSAEAPSSNDLLVVGPGVLGSYLGKLWLEEHPGAAVVGQTNSTSNHNRWGNHCSDLCVPVKLEDAAACRILGMLHADLGIVTDTAVNSQAHHRLRSDQYFAKHARKQQLCQLSSNAIPRAPRHPVTRRLKALGLQPRTKAEAGDRKFPFVAFCAPPSGSEDYAEEVGRDTHGCSKGCAARCARLVIDKTSAAACLPPTCVCGRLRLGTESALWASGAAGFVGRRFGAACHSLPPEAACRQPAVQIRPSASLDAAGMIFAGAQFRAAAFLWDSLWCCTSRVCFTWQCGLDEQLPSHPAAMC